MEQEKNSRSIAEMTKKHFEQYPDQPIEAIEEYFELSALPKDKIEKNNLNFKNNPDYYKQFQEAILHTSFMVMLVVQKTLKPETEADLEQYMREFLFFARKDDKDIYEMRMFYLNSLTAEELKIGFLEEEDLNELTDQIEKDLVLKESENRKSYYDNLLANMKKQYSESKIHLS